MRHRTVHPTVLDRGVPGRFDPTNYQYDLVPSILICQKLNFDLSNIENELDGFYGADVRHRHKHNMILSVDDGLFTYSNVDGMNLPYSRIGQRDLKHRFTYPTDNEYVHFKLFGSYVFMITSSNTRLYPEFTDYLGDLKGAFREQL